MRWSAAAGRANLALAAVLLAMAGFAADAAPRTPPPQSATAGCSQEDAPALILRLPDAGGTTIEIEVAGMPQASDRSRTIALSPLHREEPRAPDFARAALIPPDGGARWLTGTVTIDRVRPGKDVTGRYDFRMPGGRVVAGTLRAGWVPGEARCG